MVFRLSCRTRRPQERALHLSLCLGLRAAKNWRYSRRERLRRKAFRQCPRVRRRREGGLNDFAQNGIGDVLITFENEAIALGRELGADKFEIVYPSISVEAAPPVAVVDAVVDQRGTRKIATAYLDFLFSPEGQEIIAKHEFRPRDPAIALKYAAHFPPIRTFTVEGLLGGWAKVQSEHFGDGGLYDQIVSTKR